MHYLYLTLDERKESGFDQITVWDRKGSNLSNGQIIFEGKSLRRIFAVTKDDDCIQSLDKQAKVHDLPALLPVRVCTQTHRAQAGLETQSNQLVYKLYDLPPEEIAIVEGKDE